MKEIGVNLTQLKALVEHVEKEFAWRAKTAQTYTSPAVYLGYPGYGLLAVRHTRTPPDHGLYETHLMDAHGNIKHKSP